jgi:hypothetical protein
MDFLKEHLGEELYGQVSERLKGKGLKLADLSGGQYVQKDKHARAISEKEETIKAKEAELEQLRNNAAGDEQVKKQVNSLTKELEETKTELGRFKNEKAVLAVGIKAKYVNAAMWEAGRLVDKETSFEKAVEKVAKEYPEWKEEANPKPKQNSSFPLNGTGGNGGGEEGIKEAANAVFRRVTR